MDFNITETMSSTELPEDGNSVGVIGSCPGPGWRAFYRAIWCGTLDQGALQHTHFSDLMILSGFEFGTSEPSHMVATKRYC